LERNNIVVVAVVVVVVAAADNIVVELAEVINMLHCQLYSFLKKQQKKRHCKLHKEMMVVHVVVVVVEDYSAMIRLHVAILYDTRHLSLYSLCDDRLSLAFFFTYFFFSLFFFDFSYFFSLLVEPAQKK
jgi:hypothetical protein